MLVMLVMFLEPFLGLCFSFLALVSSEQASVRLLTTRTGVIAAMTQPAAVSDAAVAVVLSLICS